MDLDCCRALVCAIEEGSLTAAAVRLQYTPSGVSRTVASLEEECGFALLLRDLSPAARRFLDFLRPRLAEFHPESAAPES